MMTSPFIHAIMQIKSRKNNSSAMKMQGISPPENGARKGTLGSRGKTNKLNVIRMKNNACRKRLQIRRRKYTCNIDRRPLKGSNDSGEEEENERLTEMSLSLSSSSSSDHSSENYNVLSCFERRTCKEKDSLRSLSHGIVSVIGRRREMEDAVSAEIGLMVKNISADHDHHGCDKKYDFFAVYDGHGGSRVAEACKERLHRVLVEIIAEEYSKNTIIVWERVMEDCFEKMDEEVNRGRLTEETVGSTAVVAVVGKEELVVANCGDSRAVLSRGGVVVPLSIDHKPDRPDELKRVEAAGGRVINWNGYRILGVLATSRSIGDQHLKPFVISKPEVMVIDRTDTDEFLILASDGLWDVVSNEVACQVVRRCFGGQIKWATSVESGHENPASRAAAVLAELAMARGSSDNISVLVVELNKPTKFNGQ